MPVSGDKAGVNRSTFRPPWVKEPGTAASPSQLAKKSAEPASTTTTTTKTAPWSKKSGAETTNSTAPVTDKAKSSVGTKKSDAAVTAGSKQENGAKEAIKNVKLNPVTKKSATETTTNDTKSILKPVLKPVGSTDRRTSLNTNKKEEESELEKKFKTEKPKLRPVVSVKKTESFSKKPELEKSKSNTKTASATPSKSQASTTSTSKSTPTKTSTTSNPTSKTTGAATKSGVKSKGKAKTPTPPSSSDEEEYEEEETEEEETEEEEEEEEEESEEESEEEVKEPPKTVKPSTIANKKSQPQPQTQQQKQQAFTKPELKPVPIKPKSERNDDDDDDDDDDDSDEDGGGGDGGRRHSRIKFEKPKLRHVVINKQKSFNKSIDEFEKIRPVLKKTPKVDETTKPPKEEPKPEFVDVTLKKVPPKPAVPPPPPPPPSSGIPPPPPPPLAPPTDFEKKLLSDKQKQTLEKLKSRPRKRPDWSDMMKEVEKGRKLKHVECNDRSKPILTISKSVTKVDGQFVFETEKANCVNKLLKQIQQGVKLKPTKCNDRSKPLLEGLRKFRRQMTIEEQIQKSESKAALNNQVDIPDENQEDDSVDEMDDIDKLRDDLQSTKQMLALELRNKEAQERENKCLLSKIANLEAELQNERKSRTMGNDGTKPTGGVGWAVVDENLMKQYKKDADDARKDTKVIENKYNKVAEDLDVAKGQIEEQRRKIADLEKKLMQAVQGIIPSTGSRRVSMAGGGKESSPEFDLGEINEEDENLTEEEKAARKKKRLECEVKFLKSKLTKLIDKEVAAKKEKANIKEAMKKNQGLLKQETKKLKKLEKEVAKMAASMALDEDDEENGLENKEEPEAEEEKETESEESESESEEEEETESESEQSEPEDASPENKKSNIEPRIRKHEGRLTALKKTNFLLQTNVDRILDEINLVKEKSVSLQCELDAVVADLGI